LLHIDLRLGLEQVAVIESALNPVEEVTNELCLLALVNTLEKVGVDFLLEELVHVDLKVCLEEGLFSGTDLVHVSVHAHSFDLSHHLGLGLDLGGLGRGGQK